MKIIISPAKKMNIDDDIFEEAKELGISKRTLENAKKELNIHAKKINNSWYWELDNVKPKLAE